MPNPDGVRVRRGVFSRFFSGFFLQMFLTAGVLIQIFIIVMIIQLGGLDDVPAALAPSIVIYVIWGLGISAHAEVDAGGVRWRYYLSRTFQWSEIDKLEFGGAGVRGLNSIGRPVIRVISGEQRRPITPAYGCRDAALADFAAALTSAAHRTQTPVTVTAFRDTVWSQVRSD